MVLLRRLGFAALALVCLLLVLAAGGCEAIVTADPPGGWSCDGSFDAGVCPAGQRCINATCVPCPNGNCVPPSTCEQIDGDQDGYTLCGHVDKDFKDRDCDDNDPEVHPGATPRCNGKDNDCDGKIDNPCPEGFSCASATKSCVDSNTDCTLTPSICVAPQTCDPGTKKCFARSSKKLGEACSATAECAFDKGAFCAYSNVLPNIALGTGTDPPGICTQPCCTSSQCPADFVCYGTGTGGNYCLPKGKLGRPKLGGKTGGERCGSGTECRSGICSGGKCQDTCCNDSQCTNDTKCLIVPLQGNGATVKYVFGCGDSPGGTGFGNRCEAYCGLLCGNYPVCAEGVCEKNGTTCRAPCCGVGGCGGTSCGNPQANGHDDVVTACTGNQLQPGPKRLGEDCAKATDCATNNCLQDLTSTAKYCSDACCTDADCAGGGLVCRPYDSGSNRNYLRCQRQITALATSQTKP